VIAFLAAPGGRFDLRLTATLPQNQSSDDTNNLPTRIQTAAHLQYNLARDGVYLIQTNLSGTAGGLVLATNDVLATNSIFASVGCALSAELFQGTGGVAASLNRSADFQFTMAMPRLDIFPAGSQLQIRWPTNYSTYTLERSTNLNNPSGWTAVSGGMSVSNGFNVLTVPVGGGGNAFFRLKK